MSLFHRLALALPLLLTAALLPLQGCAPPGGALTASEEQVTRDRLARLKQQLKELQDELARARSEQADLAVRTEESPEPAWLRIDPSRPAPAGYALYGFLLATAASTESDRITVGTLLETLPRRADLTPAESGLLLVPDAEGRSGPLRLDEGHVALAAPLISPQGALLAGRPGPFLLLSDKPRPDAAERLILLDLAGRPAPFLKQLFARLQQNRHGDRLSPRERQGLLLLELAELDSSAAMTLTTGPRAILVTWMP